MQRQFTSGSRQAPDPFDQFLEENNFYRKHTARDSSCLFRVISEQMYDTQLHHLIIRKRCVRYMRKNMEFFQPLVDRDLDEYLDDLSKPKTYGTLVELQAIGFAFQRNIQLFQPFDLGNYFGSANHFSEVFRVFYTPERHFDSVFTCDYIKDAAICQSICYEILYKDLFKLPDVSFAVEQMLHSSTFEDTDCRSECNADGYCKGIQLADGRSFEFDLPYKTCCILENYKLCHFHYTNFPRLSDDLQRDIKVYTLRGQDGQDKNVLNKTVESLLPNKYMSCVRQLLQEGITPFPYKVAKALDPNMYRNIEFDSWNETRKELKLQNWYRGDTNFKVGAKCHVKLRKSENDLYTCHIQEIAGDKGYCIVFVEQLGEKRLVPYDSLTPLSPEQFKPWTLPYRLQRHMKYSSIHYTRHYNYHFKCNGQLPDHEYCSSSAVPSIKPEFYVSDGSVDKKRSYPSGAHSSPHPNSCYYKLKQYTQLENFHTQALEYCTLPLTVDHSNSDNRENDSKPQRSTENSSRAPSCSSVVTSDAQPIKQEYEETTTNSGITPSEHYEVENGGYMHELPYFYPVQPYAGGPEEYYGYYDGNVALVPANPAGGGFYYTSYPTLQPPNNLYMQAAPAHVQQNIPHPLIAAASPNGGTICSTAGGYLPNTAYYSTGMVPPPQSLMAVTSSTHLNTPITAHNLTPTRFRGACTTPLTGRINLEAKKSIKASGVDLPTDVATLRYFFNLGLDYHNKNCDSYNKRQQQRVGGSGNTSEDAAIDAKDQMANISADMQGLKLDENGNIHETKSDVYNNSNSMSNLNLNSGNGKSNQSSHPRRFTARYFNSKDRQSYQQRNNGGGGGNNNVPVSGHQNRTSNNTGAATPHQQQQPQQQHQQHDYNKNYMGGKIATSAGASMSSNSRNQVMNSTGSSTSGGKNSLHNITEQGIQTSPMLAAYAGNIPNNLADNTQNLPTIYNPNFNPFITCGSFDYGADASNGQMAPPHFAPAPPAGSLLIQMPMAPSAYGIYAAPPPPHALSMHPAAAGAYGPYIGLPPNPSAGTTIPMPSPLQGPAPPPPPHTPMTVPAKPQATHQQVNGFCAGALQLAPAGPEGVVDSNGIPIGAVDGNAAIHFQCMGFPPQVPVFYSPANVTGGGVGGGTAGSGIGGAQIPSPQQLNSSLSAAGGLVAGPPPTSISQQAYWCVPPQVNQSTHSNNGSAGSTGGGGSGSVNVSTAGNNMAQTATTIRDARRDKST